MAGTARCTVVTVAGPEMASLHWAESRGRKCHPATGARKSSKKVPAQFTASAKKARRPALHKMLHHTHSSFQSCSLIICMAPTVLPYDRIQVFFQSVLLLSCLFIINSNLQYDCNCNREFVCTFLRRRPRAQFFLFRRRLVVELLLLHVLSLRTSTCRSISPNICSRMVFGACMFNLKHMHTICSRIHPDKCICMHSFEFFLFRCICFFLACTACRLASRCLHGAGRRRRLVERLYVYVHKGTSPSSFTGACPHAALAKFYMFSHINGPIAQPTRLRCSILRPRTQTQEFVSAACTYVFYSYKNKHSYVFIIYSEYVPHIHKGSA